jgi:hypothetical protein
MPSLTEPNLKVGRAKKHLDTLEPLVKRFEESQPYKIFQEVNAEAGEYILHVLMPEIQPPDLALIAGDFVNCLRSALDQLTWQLALLTTKKPSSEIQFPIIEKDSPDAQARIARITFGIPDEAITVMKSLQPYKGGNAYRSNPLWILNKLWNIDKHRAIISHSSVLPIDIGDIDTAVKPIRGGKVDDHYIVVYRLADKDQVQFKPQPVEVFFGDRTDEDTAVRFSGLVEIHKFVSDDHDSRVSSRSRKYDGSAIARYSAGVSGRDSLNCTCHLGMVHHQRNYLFISPLLS